MKLSYLTKLMLRIAAGAETRDADDVREVVAFVRRQQSADGGFVGRRGVGDLYYTSFALRILAVFGETNEEAIAFVERAATASPRESVNVLMAAVCALILNAMTGRTVLADDLSAWTLDAIAPWRHQSGGIQTSPAASSWSTYQTFLGTAIVASLGGRPPMIRREDLLSRQRPDGGFVELEPLRASGTNPTAAAVALWQLFDDDNDGASPSWRDEAVNFLLSRQMSDGGFAANARIGVSDLLSTFTALVALDDLCVLDACDVASARNFAASCRHADGGYTGGAWDTTSDVEYTFYGVGVEAITENIRGGA
ncbi:MAG: prenyltransferase/squalene oxidase repeat-containing protein [Thermoguttaceae bacterium]